MLFKEKKYKTIFVVITSFISIAIVITLIIFSVKLFSIIKPFYSEQYNKIKDLSLSYDVESNPNASKNFVQNQNDNTLKISFDTLDGIYHFNVSPKEINTISITSNFSNGELTIKLTQGDLLKSNVKIITLSDSETITFNLDSWDDSSGDIRFWLVGKDVTNGNIEIKFN